MAKSYVGFITCHGLETLLPETEGVLASLSQRAYGQMPFRKACYWAVMPDTVAASVQQKLHGRRYQDALATLSAEAINCGTILPPVFDDTS